MSKLLKSPNIPQEIPILLNLVVYFIKASVSYGQWWRTFWPSFLITHQQQLCNTLVHQSLSCLPHPSCSSLMRYMDVPMDQDRKKGNDESKIYNRPSHLQETQNLDSPTQATEKCTATNGLSFSLSSRIYSFLFSYNGSYSEVLCLAGYFCCLVL